MDLAHAFTEFWPMMSAFPEAAVGLVAFVGVAAFVAGRFLHGGAIANRDTQMDILKERIQLKDEQIAAAKSEADRAPVKVKGEPSQMPPEPPPVDENVRRGTILSELLKLYILSADALTPQIVSGLELPPIEWMNAELERRGERWRVASAKGRNAQTYEVY